MSREKENRRCCTRSAPSPSQSRLTPCQLSQRERANPLRRSRASSPEGGAFCHLPVSTNKAPPSGELANAVSLRGFFPPRSAFTESGAANAVFLHDPTRENAMPGGPQTARHCSIISNFSAEYAQSSAERIPIVFLRTAPQPPDAPAKHTAMPRRTGSPP